MTDTVAPATHTNSTPLTPLVPCAWDRDITFFVACYNEEENIVATLETLRAALAEVNCSWDIVIIDDASTDRSVEVVESYLRSHPDLPIYLKVYKQNQGLGHNFADGAFLGRGKYYRLICGDNVEPKETFVTLLKHLGEADLIIPYQTETKGKAWSRRMLSKTYTFLVNLISGHRIRYYNGLAIHRRYDVMRWHSNHRGFGFQADLITRLLDLGCSYVEVPVVATERPKGKSKAISFKNFCSVGQTLLDILFRRLGRRRKPQRKGADVPATAFQGAAR
jgi:glycosyltransferase involved in cell wall biosynthesis